MKLHDLAPGDKFIIASTGCEGTVNSHGIGSTSVNLTKRIEIIEEKPVNRPIRNHHISLETEVRRL